MKAKLKPIAPQPLRRFPPARRSGTPVLIPTETDIPLPRGVSEYNGIQPSDLGPSYPDMTGEATEPEALTE
jgi:hypothetical protein